MAVLTYVGTIFSIVWIILIVAIADFIDGFRPSNATVTTDDDTGITTVTNT